MLQPAHPLHAGGGIFLERGKHIRLRKVSYGPAADTLVKARIQTGRSRTPVNHKHCYRYIRSVIVWVHARVKRHVLRRTVWPEAVSNRICCQGTYPCDVSRLGAAYLLCGNEAVDYAYTGLAIKVKVCAKYAANC